MTLGEVLDLLSQGERVEQRPLDAWSGPPAPSATLKPKAVAERGRTLSVDERLEARLTLPPGVGPVSLPGMDRAITEGARVVEALDTHVIRLLRRGAPQTIESVGPITRKRLHLASNDRSGNARGYPRTTAC